MLFISNVALAAPKVAVTDLAYTEAVSQYFEVSTYKATSDVNANRNAIVAKQKVDATEVKSEHQYIEQRELGGFSSDIRGEILKGTTFQLVQAKRFDTGKPQNIKAEQTLNQIKTGKLATPVKQPEVLDIVNRIKKGEFAGADYVLFGTLTSVEFRDEVSPLQGTTSTTYMLRLDLIADFSLINTKSLEIMASFSASGASSETKILSNRGDIVKHNRGKLIKDTSKALAADVYAELNAQLQTTGKLSSSVRNSDAEDTGSYVIDQEKMPAVKSNVKVIK